VDVQPFPRQRHPVPAYFSVHDTNSYTNLATMQEELCDDIAEKFGWTSFWQD